jgi:CheY-like chemotaxis protein
MEIARELLEEAGARVTPAHNGQEAVDIFRASAPGEYEVILMDVMMPVMDGLAASKAIRSLEHPDAKNISIIAMTANAFTKDEKKSLEAGMNAHLAKPLELSKVLQEIAACKNRAD